MRQWRCGLEEINGLMNMTSYCLSLELSWLRSHHEEVSFL